MQSPPFPRYLVPPRSKYSPQHHVLKNPLLDQIKDEETPHQCTFYACQTLWNPAGILKILSSVPVCALINVEDILRKCSALSLDK